MEYTKIYCEFWAGTSYWPMWCLHDEPHLFRIVWSCSWYATEQCRGDPQQSVSRNFFEVVFTKRPKQAINSAIRHGDSFNEDPWSNAHHKRFNDEPCFQKSSIMREVPVCFQNSLWKEHVFFLSKSFNITNFGSGFTNSSLQNRKQFDGEKLLPKTCIQKLVLRNLRFKIFRKNSNLKLTLKLVSLT